jgi:hypothetical protein
LRWFVWGYESIDMFISCWLSMRIANNLYENALIKFDFYGRNNL